MAGGRFHPGSGFVISALVLAGQMAAACAPAREVVERLKEGDRAHRHGDAGVHDASAAGGDGSCGVPDGGAGSCTLAGCPETFASLPAGFDLNAVWIGAAGEVWAAGEGGFVGRRAAGTGAWCWCAPAPAATLRGVWGADTGEVFVVGDSGTLLRYDGTRWLSYAGGGTDLRGVYGTSRDNVWAVGLHGYAARFDGSAWNVDGVVASYDMNAVWIDPAGLVRAAGHGTLVETVPGASFNAEAVIFRHLADPTVTGWTVEASFPQRGIATFQGLSGSSATNIWAVGVNTPSGAAAGFGFAARFDGTTWAAVPDPGDTYQSRFFTDVAVDTPDAGAVWLTARDAAGLRHDGTGFTPSPATAGMIGIEARGGAMYAVGIDGKVLRWTAGGWTVDRAARPPAAIPAP